MEDKRKEELKEKAEMVSAWLEEIRLCDEEITKVSKAFEIIDFNWPCDILVKPLDEEILEVPLMGPHREKVIDTIKEKLTERAREYKDKILKAYQNLEELLK